MKYLENEKILELLSFRHACKQFDEKRVIPPEDFETILEAGHLAPCSLGLEQTHLLLFTGTSPRDKALREEMILRGDMWGAKTQMPGVSHFVIYLSKRESLLNPDSESVAEHIKNVRKFSPEITQMFKDKMKNWRQGFGIESESDVLNWSFRQAYLVLDNMLTVAALLGIDSCPVEGFHLGKLEDFLEEKKFLDRKKYAVAACAGFGYRVNPQTPKLRQPLSDFFDLC